MKFLPEFALCWGGATITPTATEAAATITSPQHEGQNRGSDGGVAATTPPPMQGRVVRRVVKPKNAANWKPGLRVISEERVMSDVEANRRKEHGAVPSNSCGKAVTKVKAKSTARSEVSPRHGEDYWKSSVPMAVPVFAPTAFF